KEFTGNRRDDRRVRAARETTPTPRSNQLRASNNELVFPPSSNSHMSNTLRITSTISRATHTASNQRVNRHLITLNDRVLVPLAALTHSNMNLRTEVLERLEEEILLRVDLAVLIEVAVDVHVRLIRLRRRDLRLTFSAQRRIS